MNVLGAETGQLEVLAQQLVTTGQGIEEVRGQTEVTANTVVHELTETFQRALGLIDQQMQQLRQSVTAAHGRLSETTWTGANAVVFEQGYADFNSAMGSFEGAVHDAYGQFNAAMQNVSQTIVDFQGQVNTSLQQAHSSTDSMQIAVVKQKDNLEAAMNTGISFG